jgi:hypothetical protein
MKIINLSLFAFIELISTQLQQKILKNTHSLLELKRETCGENTDFDSHKIYSNKNWRAQLNAR